MRHAKQPAAQRRTATQPRWTGYQDQERRLKCIFRVMPVAQDTRTDREHQIPMPPDQALQRRRVLFGEESIQKLSVAFLGHRVRAWTVQHRKYVEREQSF